MYAFHVITIFPDFVRSVFEYGVLRRALESGAVTAKVHDLRDFTTDRHRTTDDAPYGGGPGMVMLAEPVFKAVEQIRSEHGPLPLVYLSPAGQLLTHRLAQELALAPGAIARAEADTARTEVHAPEDGARTSVRAEEESAQTEVCAPNPGLILLCGRYEGIDQRIIDLLVDREISVGDYVLSGGELAAMVLIDAVARLLPGVLGNEESSGSESFSGGLLDWPHYTRPELFRGEHVPAVLLSGNHAKIMDWRERCALLLTFRRRPELLSEEQAAQARRLLASEEDCRSNE